MTNANLIKDTLEALGYPAFNGFTMSDDRVYFIFDLSTEGILYADNRPVSEITYATVHLFAQTDFDPIELVEKTKRALFAVGYTWPEVIPVSSGSKGYGSEADDMRHYVFECERADMISAEEG